MRSHSRSHSHRYPKQRFLQLNDWLSWLETLHPKSIDLGLSRVFEVAHRLELINVGQYPESGTLNIPSVDVYIVAGTNGKGSCVNTLEQSLLLRGCHVASYTSPHIHHYCERIQINGEPVSERIVCDAFAAIDHAREDISLTYFEFGTLAALWIFIQEQVPNVILEVGLGGRLDAVNIVDANIALLTSVALDHQEWLGNDLDHIALEKLGVSRPDNTVVIAEQAPLNSIKQFSQSHADCYLSGRDFLVQQDGVQTVWQCSSGNILSLPSCALAIDSVVAGLQALHLRGYSITQEHIDRLLPSLALTGRFQCIEAMSKQWLFDVAHNVAAVKLLAQRADVLNHDGRTFAVFAAMKDKDIAQMIDAMKSVVDYWFIGDLCDNPRAIDADTIGQILCSQHLPYSQQDSLLTACLSAIERATEHDRIIVFGSFFTVADVQQLIFGEKSGAA